MSASQAKAKKIEFPKFAFGTKHIAVSDDWPIGSILVQRPLAPRGSAFPTVNLLANNRDGPLIDRSSIPCLDRCEIGFAGLISRASAPAMALEEIRRRVQRIGRDVEISASAIV